MLGDIFGKLQEAKQKIEEAKKSLNSVIIETQSEDGLIRVRANANKVITSIEIAEDLTGSGDREKLEDLLLVTLNRALEKAANKGEAEMKKITEGIIPDFPGLT